MSARTLLLSSVLTLSLMNTGCATAGGNKTAVQAAMQNCALTVALGTIGGGIIGNQIGKGKGNAKKGALIGALAAVGVCGFLLNEASQRDKERIRELQIAALNKEEYGLTRGEFTSDKGRNITVQTVTSEADLTDKPVPVSTDNTTNSSTGTVQTAAADSSAVTWSHCRNSQVSMSVDGGNMKDLGKTYECRTSLGDWVVIA
ncbi:MAG TPA: hypothetical protein ENK06_05555 [Gammaproteobacteria bacterium]|nr:hypothetical protein [Gammaproteobacteria bacterium]